MSENTVLTSAQIKDIIKSHLVGGYNGDYLENDGFEMARAIEAAVLSSQATVAPTWRCFHCDEVFTSEEDARLHFGKSERESPACTIDISEYRAMETRMQFYNDEDAEIHRSMARLQSDHNLALQREEEKGYDRGVRDQMAEAIQSAQVGDVVADDMNRYIIMQRHGMIPDRKGPFVNSKHVEKFLREVYETQPDTVCTVIEMPDISYPQSGRQWLDMYGDQRRKRVPAAPSVATVAQKDAIEAARWRETLLHIGGRLHHDLGQIFTLNYIRPVEGANIMRGGVAEHFTNAIDSARLAANTRNHEVA